MLHHVLDYFQKRERDRLLSFGTEAEKKQAFDTFIANYRHIFQKNMSAHLYKLRGYRADKDEVYELFTDTAIDFWHHLEKGKAISKSAEALFWTIAGRREKSAFLAKNKIKFQQKSVEDLGLKDTLSENSKNEAEMEKEIWEKVSIIAGNCMILLRYYYVEERSYDEIAILIDKTEGYVRQTLFRCKEKLRAKKEAFEAFVNE